MPAIVAYPATPTYGGLGQHSRQVLDALASVDTDRVEAFGPPLPDGDPLGQRIMFGGAPPPMPAWYRRFTPYRYDTGRYQFAADTRFGRWLASALETRTVTRAYFLTQIAAEALHVAHARGARTIVDSPTGHVRDYREMLRRESERWVRWPYIGHPGTAMVDRVEGEYALADHLRVSSEWAKRSLVRHGVDAAKIFVAPQRVDIARYTPADAAIASSGPLRVSFVGSFSLGKGFQYLLEAVRRVGPQHVRLELVGATGDLWSRRLFERLSAGLDVVHTPGSPLETLHRSELFVFPTLHDGFGLAVVEALACGLPVITTDACGAAEWLAGTEAGWTIPAGNLESLVAALDRVLTERSRLSERRTAARQVAERLSASEPTAALAAGISACWTSQARRAS